MGTLYNPLPVPQPIPGAPPSATGTVPFSLSSILGPPLGLDTSGSFALSTSGLAVQVGDRYITGIIGRVGDLLVDQLLDVTSLIIPGVNPYVYRLPAPRVRRGDLILISDSPVTVRYVLDYLPNGRILGLDPATGSVTEAVPAQNPFASFFIQLVSLFDFPSVPFESAGWRGGGDRRPGREGEEMGERPEMGILLASLLLNQQSGQTTTSSLQTLLPFLLLSGGGCGGGVFEMLALVAALQQQGAGGTGQPLQGDGIALALLLLGMGQGYDGPFQRWRHHERGERGPWPPPPDAGPKPA